MLKTHLFIDMYNVFMGFMDLEGINRKSVLLDTNLTYYSQETYEY